MPQNIYDNPTFFTAYSHLPRSQHGLAGAPEWPTLRAMLGDLTATHVLDLGCGYGWFCRWAVDEGGASSAHGIDISEKMLERARELQQLPNLSKSATLTSNHSKTGYNSNSNSHSKISYERADLDTVNLKEEEYEVVYSSLAFHYLGDLGALFAQVRRALKGGGRFVFSVEHPVFTAGKGEWKISNSNSNLIPIPNLGSGTGDGAGTTFSDGDGGGREGVKEGWVLDGYADEGPRTRSWLGENVRKYHRTMQTYLSLLRRSGLELVDVVEWMPSKEDIEEHPDWAGERHRPMFLLISARKI